MMAGHEEKAPLPDDDIFDISDDDSGAGSLSDSYFMQRPDMSASKTSSHSLCYSPTSPLSKSLSKRPIHPTPIRPVPPSTVGSIKPPSIKTGNVFYQGSGRTWWHASEYDPLYDPATTPSSSIRQSYGSSEFAQSHSIQEHELGVFEEEEKVMPLPSDPYNVLPSQSHRAREKKRLRQLRRKQMEQIAREQRVKEIRGTPQEVTTCHDSIFAALFVAQLVLVLFCAIKFGSGIVFFEGSGWSPFTTIRGTEMETPLSDDDLVRFLSSQNTDDDSALSQFVSDKQTTTTGHHVSQMASSFVLNYRTVMSITGITGFYACILSLVTVGFMLIIANSLIETTLIFCIILSLAWGVIGYVLEPAHWIVPALGFVAFFLFVAYTVVVWDRIPFSATNLGVALSAMRSSANIIMLGLVMLMVSFAWCLVWCMAFIGLVNTLDLCEPGDVKCRSHRGHGHVFLFFAFFFSFYWTNVVIINITKVSVANAVGTFWFHPEEMSPCCSSSIVRAFLRAITTSLGSICLGSLVVLPAQIIAALTKCCCLPDIYRYRPNTPRRGCGGILQDLAFYMRRCNRWSFSYIGMYGYSFSEGGEKAIQLFETREWLTVVNDNLIHNVLLMASIVIGGSAGIFGVLVEEMDGYAFTSFHKPIITAFLIGSVLGFILSNVLLSGVVGSALNTVLVCFAAGPFEFHKNHALLSEEMRDVWSQHVWEQSV
jgi:hypothetical protein